MKHSSGASSRAGIASAVLVSASLGLAACRQAPAEPAPVESELPSLFRVHHSPADAKVARSLEALLEQGRVRVESFFGAPFEEPVPVDLLPDRAAFTAWFPAEWGMGETACWMVASGVADGLAVLSPRVWRTDACEHDPDDAAHVREVVIHELVHVYHGRHNPTRDFEGAEGIGWFLEGLATHVSGQLEAGHRERAIEAVASGAAPQRLAEAWSGPYRYGVSGTLVEYLDLTFGRAALFEMLAFTSEEELLGFIGLSEVELLDAWRAFVETAGWCRC